MIKLLLFHEFKLKLLSKQYIILFSFKSPITQLFYKNSKDALDDV